MGEFSCCAMNHTYGKGSLARVLPCDRKGIVQVLNVMFNAKIKHQLPVAPGMSYVLCGLEHVVYAGAEHFSHLLHPSDMMAIEGETVEHFAARVGLSSVDDNASVFAHDALGIAVILQDCSMVQKLLALRCAGASWYRNSVQVNAFDIAVPSGNVDVVRTILATGDDWQMTSSQFPTHLVRRVCKRQRRTDTWSS